MRRKDRDADKQEKKCEPERGGRRRPATSRSAMTAPTISVTLLIGGRHPDMSAFTSTPVGDDFSRHIDLK
jgi:hypothetical protein